MDATASPPRVRQGRLQRGAYLLPSLFTVGNMLLGFYAVVCGFRGLDSGNETLFGRAALLVFAAAILDGLDGRIARMVGTESEFGKEYDSLADVITFGMTPALLTYFWGLYELGRVGWLVPLFFMVCCATRLARFNVQTRIVDSRFFVGLPTPAAAGTICSILFFAPDREYRPYMMGLLVFALIAGGLLMVSTFRFRSFKKFDLKKRWSYRAVIPVAAVVLVTAIYPPAFFLAVAVLYTLSGPAAWLWARLRRGQRSGAASGETASPEMESQGTPDQPTPSPASARQTTPNQAPEGRRSEAPHPGVYDAPEPGDETTVLRPPPREPRDLPLHAGDESRRDESRRDERPRDERPRDKSRSGGTTVRESAADDEPHVRPEDRR